MPTKNWIKMMQKNEVRVINHKFIIKDLIENTFVFFDHDTNFVNFFFSFLFFHNPKKALKVPAACKVCKDTEKKNKVSSRCKASEVTSL